MPRIMVKLESLRALGSQLQQVAGDVQAVEARLSRVMAGLDWDLRSRAGVDNQWYNARSLARSTAQRADAMARFLIRKAQAFEDADRQGAGMVVQTGTTFVAAIREWVQSPFGKTNSFSWQKIDNIIKLGLLGAVGLAFPAVGIFALPAVGTGILKAVVPGLRPSIPTASGLAPQPPSEPAGSGQVAGAFIPGAGTTPSALNTIVSIPPNADNATKAQIYLVSMGFDIGKDKNGSPLIDGKWGTRSTTATLIFQYSMGLKVTGKADEATLKAMEQVIESGKVTDDVVREFVPAPTGLGKGGGSIEVEYRKLEPKETVTINGCPLHPDAAVAWAYMVTEARKDGIESPLLLPESGYRSIEKQKELYNDEVNKWLPKGLSLEEARKMARKWVATPGNSEHHTGMAVDLDMSLSSCKENAAQLKMTREYQWLRDNAKKYGFYNYEAEPWHWVYNPPSK